MLRLIACWSALAVAAGAAPSQAATASATIAVTATVVGNCSVAGAAIPFGVYSPGTTAAREGSLTVTCSPGTAYVVALDDGRAGDAATRRMEGPGGSKLPYDLYRDAARSVRWRDGSTTAAGVGTGNSQSMAVHAAIDPAASLAARDYSDTVTATLTY